MEQRSETNSDLRGAYDSATQALADIRAAIVDSRVIGAILASRANQLETSYIRPVPGTLTHGAVFCGRACEMI